MAGESVPLVLLPRYTALAGRAGEAQYFRSVPLDITPYERAWVTLWRGRIVGTQPSPPPPPLPIEFWFEQSTDQVTWTATPPTPQDPGENTQVQVLVPFVARWLRIAVKLYHADNVVSCFAVGHLEERIR